MRHRSKTWPWIISIAVHVAVLTAVGLWAYKYYEGGDASRRDGGGGNVAKKLEPTPDDARKAWKHEETKAETQPGEENLAELEKRLDELDAIRFRDVKGAAGFAESVKGVKQDRWYRPNPRAEGRFQADSATLFDITRRIKNGKVVYVHTLVDADGRTVRAEVPEKQMTPADLRAYRVFELSRKSPKLRYLVESALKIGENMTRQGSGKRGAGSGEK